MSITITLTPEQIAEVVGQFASAANRQLEAVNQRLSGDNGGSIHDGVVRYINGLAKKTTFRTARLAFELGVDNAQAISPTLSGLRKKGIVEMVRRGTWRKL